ncbi:MAG: protein kinase [Acidobacteriota bacterium]|nr:protein kinase [Acidobacteriota bacterium]
MVYFVQPIYRVDPMKGCPTCKGTYAENLAFCPHDGTALLAANQWSAGQVIGGKYRLLGKVGAGGMGTVYKALHLAFDESRALKAIRQDLAQDELFVKRFKQEAVIARKLQHPNAVRVDDIDEAEDGRPFIVMEFIEGPSLRDVVEMEGALSVERVCSMAKQVAAALDAAHRLGMVHRDIKPANIVLVPLAHGEQAKVLDFGIAKLKEARAGAAAGFTLTGAGVVIGTPQYMSPEQAMGKRGDELDGRSDLYSLGIVMYQALTGRLPFKADTTMQMLMDHIHTPPKPVQQARPGIPECVARLVMQCLEKKPEMRPASAGALIRDIENAEEEIARERLEKERLARARADAELARVRAEEERLLRAKAEQEMLARRRAEAERRAAEREEAQRLARAKADEERRAREAATLRQRELEKAVADRRAAEKAEAKRLVQAHKQKGRRMPQATAATGPPLWKRHGLLAILIVAVAIISGTVVWRLIRPGSPRGMPQHGQINSNNGGRGLHKPQAQLVPNPPASNQQPGSDTQSQVTNAVAQADSYVAQGDYASATGAYALGQKLAPGNEAIANKAAQARRAQAADRAGAESLARGDYSGAIREFERERRLEPGNKALADRLSRVQGAESSIAMAMSYMNKGEYNQAISALKQALKFDPQGKNLSRMLARAKSARAAEAKYGIHQN